MESDLFVFIAWFRAYNKTLVIYRFTKYSYVPLATDKAIAIVLHFYATHREYLDLKRWTHFVFCVFISGDVVGTVLTVVGATAAVACAGCIIYACKKYDTIVASIIIRVFSIFVYIPVSRINLSA